MSCSDILRQYSKYLLVFTNFIFLILGMIIASIGFTIKAYYNEYVYFLENKFFYASDFVIAVGFIISIISFFGCYGASKESPGMTWAFSMLMTLILILEVIIFITAYILKGKTETLIESSLKKTMGKYNNVTEITDMWDKVQRTFHCCGVDNYTDWQHENNTHDQLPISCCTYKPGTVGPSVDCSPNTTNSNVKLHKQGCLTEFGQYIKYNMKTIEGTGLGFALLQFVVITLSCYLTKQLRSDYQAV